MSDVCQWLVDGLDVAASWLGGSRSGRLVAVLVVAGIALAVVSQSVGGLPVHRSGPSKPARYAVTYRLNGGPPQTVYVTQSPVP